MLSLTVLPFITCLLTSKDNYYANYLTSAWISSFDPCTSRGQIFVLILRSEKLDLYTGKYGKSRNIWLSLRLSVISDLLRLVYSFVSCLKFDISLGSSQNWSVNSSEWKQRFLAISLKSSDFSYHPNLLNERNLPFWNAQSTALKTEMVPISLPSAEQNRPISFSFSWLRADHRRKMAVCEGKYPLLHFFRCCSWQRHISSAFWGKKLGLTVVDLVVDYNQTKLFVLLSTS